MKHAPPLIRSADSTCAPESLGSLPSSLLQNELRRIVASAAFQTSPRHRRFLEYLVAHAVKADGARLKEITLGIEVFDRRASTYDPQRDTIVRVEARRLRARLARYYEEEGRRSLIRIELPVGSYVPLIRRREIGNGGAQASLAVLPIFNATDDARLDAIGDDLTDDLIDALARLPGIKVIAHHSVFRFRDAQPTAESLRVIAATLGVGMLLRGVLTADDPTIRIKLKLLRAHDATELWSEAHLFTRDAGFAGRTALIDTIVEGLHTRFVDADTDAMQAVPARSGAKRDATGDDRRARDLVDRGRFVMRQGTTDGYEQALARFREAIAIDPLCAPAHLGIARVQTHRAGMTLTEPRHAVAEAREAAARALSLDPGLGEAASLVAGIAWRYERDWPRAQAGFLAAIDRVPGSLYVHFNYAFALIFARRFDEAEAELRLARELDPLDIGLRAVEALLAIYRHDYPRAESLLDALLADEPRHLLARTLLGSLLLFRARPDDALREYRQARELAPHISIGSVGIAQAHAMAGRTDEARVERERMLREFEARYLSPYQLAMIALRLGEEAAALDALRRAADEADPNFITILVDPTFDAVRSDPRYLALIDDTGLAHALPQPISPSPPRPRRRPRAAG